MRPLPFLFFLLSLASTGSAVAQAAPPVAHYWVELRDKAGVRFDAATYFVPEARARRQRQHLPAADSTDFAVRTDYVRAVRLHSDSILLVSRWFNAVACRATPAQAAALARLPGVRQVQPLAHTELVAAARAVAPRKEGHKTISTTDRLLARRQVRTLGADAFGQAALDGKGLRIAVFDVGFNGADQHPAFRELFAQKRIVATYDFARHTTAVFHGGSHGTEVLACLAGRLPDGTPLGLATGADYLLARTERMHREIYTEELDWLAAVEWADRNGADIINSSLGYTARRYFPEEMNGRLSLVARAANLAARKGMLVVNAAGNDGDNEDWRTVGTPADADSVLAVGGLDPETGLHLNFSAFGPTADRRLKPNVAAFGTVLTAAPGGYSRVDGTSFASPLVAGFAACVWQQQRGLTAMQLFQKLQESASLYPYYDYAHGYGLPQAGFFLQKTAATHATKVDFVVEDSILAVNIRPEATRLMVRTLPFYADSLGALPDAKRVPRVGREEPRPLNQGQTQSVVVPESEPVALALPAAGYLYWHVSDSRGVLRRYEVVEVSQRAILRIPRRTLQPGDVVRVYYLGTTHSYPVL
ncbi:S8 family serine peptidase [Hymenobacter sediminicola]|uniref:S8 family serine peptidase n=1 Tax=Hymenobacter sediminicola TaxID=2761579 RepID=A0A7G7W2H1_9BACT|nr:S8 family serine peptidase [Hymenobacter sediminicola]QNH60564.1 S8 family serine peptidase [Hymenobacter sediminicola]